MNTCWRDAAQVTGGIVSPHPVLHVLQVAGPGEGQGLLPVEGHAAGLHDVEARVRVAHGPVEVERHTVDGVDDPLEALEVDLHVVVDLDAEVVADGVDELLGAPLVGGVDPLVRPRPRDGHPQVALSERMSSRSPLGVDPHDHDDVGPLALRASRCRPG